MMMVMFPAPYAKEQTQFGRGLGRGDREELVNERYRATSAGIPHRARGARMVRLAGLEKTWMTV